MLNSVNTVVSPTTPSHSIDDSNNIIINTESVNANININNHTATTVLFNNNNNINGYNSDSDSDLDNNININKSNNNNNNNNNSNKDESSGIIATHEMTDGDELRNKKPDNTQTKKNNNNNTKKKHKKKKKTVRIQVNKDSDTDSAASSESDNESSSVCDIISNKFNNCISCCSSSGNGNLDERYGHKFSMGERVADTVSMAVGSWRFVITQSTLLAIWLLLNIILSSSVAWDPYPFILLNLMLSFQAAYTAPIIMMSQNRAAEVDRIKAEDLHEKVDHVRLNQMFTLWETMQVQTKQIHMLETKLDTLTNIFTAHFGINPSINPNVNAAPSSNTKTDSKNNTVPNIIKEDSTTHRASTNSASVTVSNLRKIFPPVSEAVGEAAFVESIELIDDENENSLEKPEHYITEEEEEDSKNNNNNNNNDNYNYDDEDNESDDHSSSNDGESRSKKKRGIANMKFSFQQLVKNIPTHVRKASISSGSRSENTNETNNNATTTGTGTTNTPAMSPILVSNNSITTNKPPTTTVPNIVLSPQSTLSGKETSSSLTTNKEGSVVAVQFHVE